MTEKKKRIRKKEGQVFQVPLGDGTFGYGQVSDFGCAFFDYRDHGTPPPVEEIVQKPILFRIGVNDYAIKEGLFPVIGMLSVNPELKGYKPEFTYDTIKRQYYICGSRMEEIPAKPEEIQDLECFASWGHLSVIQRLKDHFEGRPNFSYEQDRNQHNPNFPKTAKEFYAQYGYDFTLLDEEK